MDLQVVGLEEEGEEGTREGDSQMNCNRGGGGCLGKRMTCTCICLLFRQSGLLVGCEEAKSQENL